jgi:hypothetical protein
MSDPSALNIPISQALTSDMLLGLKPCAPKSRSYRISIAPINKSVFNPSDQIIFELPTSRKGTWLDQSQSYLKFSVQCASTTACGQGGSGIYLDNSAYSFLQRLDIYHGSNLLETCSEWGQLQNFLIDTSLTQSDKAGLSTLIGTNHANISYSNVLTNSGVIDASSKSDISGQILTGNYRNFIGINAQVQTPGDRSGFSLASVALASGISTAIPYTFSLPLLSGVIGINASKMIPMGKLTSPLRVEMYLSSNDNLSTMVLLVQMLFGKLSMWSSMHAM